MTECVRNTIPDKGNNSAELSTVLSTWSPISTVIKLMTVEKQANQSTTYQKGTKMSNQILSFNADTCVTLITHNNRYWLTAEDVGRCLGYTAGNERQGIIKAFNRHIDEFSEEDSCVVKLATQGQMREFRIFSQTGCVKLGFFSNTPTAKTFRKWAARVLSGETPAHHSQVAAQQAAYLAANPEAARLLRYLALGLNHAEIGKLLDISGQAVRDRLKKLAKLGLADYTPNPALSERGKLGNAAKQAQRAFLANQQSLALEG